MIESLGPFVTQAIAERPQLREKNSVDVAVVLGADHERLYWHLLESPHTKDQVAASVALVAGRHRVYGLDKKISGSIRSNQPVEKATLINYYEIAS